uniref:Uncharacterized protein n=1 Tax=Arundo donax TaxID=35708 RepID=A0A0A8ZV65_ARUDO
MGGIKSIICSVCYRSYLCGHGLMILLFARFSTQR